MKSSSELTSHDIERATLCALIQAGIGGDASPKEKCKEALPYEAFTDTAHKTIYQTIIKNGELLDLPLLWREIEKTGYSDLIDKSYLMEISTCVTGKGHIDSYIRELNECYATRKKAESDPGYLKQIITSEDILRCVDSNEDGDAWLW